MKFIDLLEITGIQQIIVVYSKEKKMCFETKATVDIFYEQYKDIHNMIVVGLGAEADIIYVRLEFEV